MTDLERRLTTALERLSEQYETEQRRHSEQVGALQRQVEALRARVERQTEENDTLRRQVERLSAQVTRLSECYGTSAAARPRGHGW